MELKNAMINSITKTERKCNSCGFATFCLRVLYQHKRKCQGKLLGLPLRCGSCKRKYNFFFLLKKHQKTCVKRNRRIKAILTDLKKLENGKSCDKKTEKIESKSSAIVCPNCMEFFSSWDLYKSHEKSGVCQPKQKVKKKSFSARKSLSKPPSTYKKKIKLSKQTSDSDSSFLSDNLLSDIVERQKRLFNSGSRGYKCLYCKNKYPAKNILLKHLELNYRCALAHYEQGSYQKTTDRARKTIQPEVARKSFSNSSYRNRSYQSKRVHHSEGSARKSMPNISYKKSSKSRFVQSHLNQCPVCNDEFPDTFNFFQHQKKFNHWGNAKKSINLSCRCPFCQKEFFSIRARNAHIRNHADKSDSTIESFLKSTTCDVCSQIFVTETLKQQHIKIEHPKQSQTAGGNDINSEINLNTNSNKYVSLPLAIKQQLKQRPFVCPICAKTFVTTILRNKHFESNHLPSNLECKFCPIKCSSMEILDNHMQQLHYDQFKYECHVCKDKLPTASHVLLHVKKLHSKSSIQSRVQPVGQPTTSRTMVNEKIQSHELQDKQQGYFCDICDISFLKLQYLRRHEQSKQHRDTLIKNLDAVHESLSNLPPSPPPALPKQVKAPDVLSCSECFEEFTTLKDFVPHRLSHFSEKSKYMQINEENTYTCEICGDVSDSHSKVQLHLFWHLQVEQASKEKKGPETTKNNPLNGSKSSGQHVAKKSFGKQSHETHQEVVIGGVKKNLFTCEACHIGFMNQTHYNLHVRRFCKMKNTPLKKSEKVLPEAINEKPPRSSSNTLIKKDEKTIPETNSEKLSNSNNALLEKVETATSEAINEKLPQNTSNTQLKKTEKVTSEVINEKLPENNSNTLLNEAERSTPESFNETLSENSSALELDKLKNVENNLESENIEQCQLCSSIFNTSIKQVHEEFCSKCQTDSDAFGDLDSLIFLIRDKKGVAACLMCNCVLESSELFLHHMLSSHMKTEEIEASVNIVQEEVEGENVIHCLTCNCIFFSTDVLGDHEKACSEFSYTNSKLENFTPDFKAVLEQNSIIASCITCDLAFNNKNDLTEHVALHQKDVATPAVDETSVATVEESFEPTSEEKMDIIETVVSPCEQSNAITKVSSISTSEQEYQITSFNGEKSLDFTDALTDTHIPATAETKDSLIVSSNMPSNSLQNSQLDDAIDNLRKNFSQLLSILVSDPDLMQHLGYGELTVDEVLIKVLQTMEQTPFLKDENTSDIDCLRKNIQILLDFCLEDQVMALIGDGKASTDELVVEALKIFGGESSMSIVAIE